MNAYFDASALTSLLLIDSGSGAVDRWIADVGPDIAISDFGWGEFVSALSIRVRAGATTGEIARALLVEHERNVRHWPRIAITSEDVSDATDTVARAELSLRLPDAIHIAVARRTGQILVIRDQQQFRAAQTLGLAAVHLTNDA